MRRSLTKAVWLYVISDGRIGLILLAITFVIILRMTLQRAIGLYFFKDSDDSHFGIKVIMVSLIPPGRKPFSNHVFPVLKTSSPICAQKFSKKRGLNPSGPGALSGCIWKRLIQNSSFVKVVSRRAMFLSVNLLFINLVT